MNKLSAGLVAEFVGTFGLMFFGGAAILHAFPDAGIVAVALAHGLILATMVTATMHVSGGQLNPSVSLALAVMGKQPFGQAAAFIAAQLAGSVAAAALLKAAFTENAATVGKLGATLGSLSTGEQSDTIMVLALEAVATFFLMFSVLGSAVDQRGTGGTRAVGGFAIGLTVSACILAIGPLTGASMNPARSFGPALVGGYWTIHFAYWLAPIIGATTAGLVWKHVVQGRSE